MNLKKALLKLFLFLIISTMVEIRLNAQIIHIYDVKNAPGSQLTINGTTINYADGVIGTGTKSANNGDIWGAQAGYSLLSTDSRSTISNNATGIKNYIYVKIAFSQPRIVSDIFKLVDVDGATSNLEFSSAFGMLNGSFVQPVFNNIGQTVNLKKMTVTNKIPTVNMPNNFLVCTADSLPGSYSLDNTLGQVTADFKSNLVDEVYFLFGLMPNSVDITTQISGIYDGGLEKIANGISPKIYNNWKTNVANYTMPNWYDKSRVQLHTRLAGTYDPAYYNFSHFGDLVAGLNVRAYNRHIKTNEDNVHWKSAIGSHTVRAETQNIIQECVDDAHENNIKMVGYYNHYADAYFRDKYPSWKCRSTIGATTYRSARGLMLCFNSPYRDSLIFRIKEYAAMGGDGVYFDEIHQPTDGCFCSNCKGLFFQEYGVNAPTTGEIDVTTNGILYRQFLNEKLTETFNQLNQELSETYPEFVMQLGSNLVPSFRINYLGTNPLRLSMHKTEFDIGTKTLNGPGLTSIYKPTNEDLRMVGLLQGRDFSDGRPGHIWVVGMSYIPKEMIAAAAGGLIAVGDVANLDMQETTIPDTDFADAITLGNKMSDVLAGSKPYYFARIHYNEFIQKTQRPNTVGGWQNFYSPMVGAFKAFRELKYPFGFITDSQIEDGLLANSDLLFLPNGSTVATSVSTKINEFTAGGGQKITNTDFTSHGTATNFNTRKDNFKTSISSNIAKPMAYSISSNNEMHAQYYIKTKQNTESIIAAYTNTLDWIVTETSQATADAALAASVRPAPISGVTLVVNKPDIPLSVINHITGASLPYTFVANALYISVPTFQDVSLIEITYCTNPTLTITCPAALSVNADLGLCTYASSQLSPPTATNNCVVANVVASPSSLVLGANTVTWTATDGASNTATCSQTVTVLDNQNPVITCTAAISVNADLGVCTFASSQLSPPTATDNCGITSIVANPTSLVLGANTVTWTATDNSGNTSICSQEVTVIDNQNPVITCAAAISVNADLGVCTFASIQLSPPTATDNCQITSIVANPTSLVLGSNSVTWTATDATGNTATCSQTVIVLDNQNPVITCAATISVNADLGVCTFASSQLSPPTATDNCQITSIVASPISLVLGANTVIWTATDNSGNTSICTQTVTVLDNQVPVINCAAAISVNADLGLCTFVSSQLNPPTATDNCGITSIIASPTSLVLGANTVTWTASDNSGNTSICSQEVTVIDNQNPVIICAAAISVNADLGVCTFASSQLSPPTATDNCGITSIVASPTSLVLGVNMVIWTATDNSGNTANCSQEVTVLDNQVPVINCAAAISVNADFGVCTFASSQLSPPTATDNCGITSISASPTSLVLGANTVTWTATDNSGNSSICNQIVTVLDNQNPIITCAAAISVNADLGACTFASGQLSPPTATDNCGITSIVASPTSLVLGANTVAWTATDNSGNTSICSQEVTVIDNEPPTPPTILSIIADCSVTPMPPIAQDNCMVEIVGTANTSFPIQSSSTIIWTFNDGNGNISTASQIVTINNCTDIVGTIFNNEADELIGVGTAITSGYFISIFKNLNITETPDFVSPINNLGNFTIPNLINGTYKLIIGTNSSGSREPTFLNGKIANKEGLNGTNGDGTPNGIIEITLPNGVLTPNAKKTAQFEIGFTQKNSGALPIDLLSLSGIQIGQQINLTWKTANEKEFSHFEILKSNDTKEFGSIGKVNSTQSTIYNFVDTNPTEGVNYYRLKMVDVNGASKLSNTISVYFEKSSGFITIENPTRNGEFKVITNLKYAKFTLVNSIGLKIQTTITENGLNNFNIKLNNSVSGLYFLRMESEGKIQIKKVIIP